jgi:hypothetical protein
MSLESVLMIEPKLAATQQHPDGLLDQRRWVFRVRRKVFDKALALLVARRPAEDRQVKQLNTLFP